MEIRFPLNGIDRSGATGDQPSLTSPSMNNVRPIDQLNNRMRGGQRPGLDKWGAGTLIGAANHPVVAMCCVRTVK